MSPTYQLPRIPQHLPGLENSLLTHSYTPRRLLHFAISLLLPPLTHPYSYLNYRLFYSPTHLCQTSAFSSSFLPSPHLPLQPLESFSSHASPRLVQKVLHYSRRSWRREGWGVTLWEVLLSPFPSPDTPPPLSSFHQHIHLYPHHIFLFMACYYPITLSF